MSLILACWRQNLERDTCNSKKESAKKSFKESLKGKLFDVLETVDSHIEVETMIDQMKNWSSMSFSFASIIWFSFSLFISFLL